MTTIIIATFLIATALTILTFQFSKNLQTYFLDFKYKILNRKIKEYRSKDLFATQDYIYKRAQELGISNYKTYLDDKNVIQGKDGKFKSKKLKGYQPNFVLQTQ